MGRVTGVPFAAPQLGIIGWARVRVGSRTAVLMLVECALATALTLVLLWSPISADEPNARLATALRLTFLGQQDWPIGLGLLLGASACRCLASTRRCGAQHTSQ